MVFLMLQGIDYTLSPTKPHPWRWKPSLWDRRRVKLEGRYQLIIEIEGYYDTSNPQQQIMTSQTKDL